MDDTLKFIRITILTIALSAARVKLGHFMHHDRDFYALFCYFKISSFSAAIFIMDAGCGSFYGCVLCANSVSGCHDVVTTTITPYIHSS